MAIRPGKYNALKPDIELFDYKSKKRFGLKLEGSGALQVGTISQDDSVHVRSAGKRVGDFDEQRSWKGGRGVEKLSSNPEAYWDSMNAWSLTDGHLSPTLLWRFARGLRSCDFSMPNATKGLTWKTLLGTSKSISIAFTSMGFSADHIRAWIRKVGVPGTLTVGIYTNNEGVPGTLINSGTAISSSVTDVISVLQKFHLSGLATLVAATTYHIVATTDSTDDSNNHWEIGGYSAEGATASGVSYTGKRSSDFVTWTGDTFDLFYYTADIDISRTFFSFFLDDAMYLVDKKDDLTTTSKLYINGDRGKATSGGGGSITDTGKAWTTNKWAGAWVKIVRGTGFGQAREIWQNTATQITLLEAWAVTPSTDSEYIIYGTEWFTEIATTGLGVVISQPLVANQIVYFPQDAVAYVRKMVWNATTPGHSFSTDGTNLASFFTKSFDTNGTKIWRVINGRAQWQAVTVSYAPAASAAASPATLVYATGKVVGDITSLATGVVEKDGSIFVFKEDGLWRVDNVTFSLTKIQNGMDKIPSKFNGSASIAHQQFLFYSWLHSVIRVYGSSHDDVGQDWSGYGLPDGREGNFSSFDSYTSLLFGGVDAGPGTSSVLGFDGLGWHELLRAYDDNMRIRMVKIQPCQDTRNRQWTEIGGDLVYQEMPFMKGSPRLDEGVRYMHEFVVESATIDMGTASALPKFIKELTVFAEGLGDGNEIHVDYQADDDVHTSNWTNATTLFQSPESTAFLGLSDVRTFAYRLRCQSRHHDAPVDILGVMPNGYARSPYKMVWTLRCKADNIISRGRIVKPDMLMRWLLDSARFPGRVEMLSQYELAHKFFVIIHPPRMFPYKPASNGQAEESVFTIVLEEA